MSLSTPKSYPSVKDIKAKLLVSGGKMATEQNILKRRLNDNSV